MTQRITQDPDPCSPGDTVKFCYDIDGATLPVKLMETFDGHEGVSRSVTGEEDRCWTTTVPKDATGGQITDGTGQSEDFEINVSP